MTARNLITLGPVADSAVAAAARMWQPEQVNGMLAAGQMLLVLYDPHHTSPHLAGFFTP